MSSNNRSTSGKIDSIFFSFSFINGSIDVSSLLYVSSIDTKDLLTWSSTDLDFSSGSSAWPGIVLLATPPAILGVKTSSTIMLVPTNQLIMVYEEVKSVLSGLRVVEAALLAETFICHDCLDLNLGLRGGRGNSELPLTCTDGGIQ